MHKAFFTSMLAVATVAVSVVSAVAQDSVAEIQTWRGDSVRVNQPALDVLYTIAPAPLLGPTGAPVAGGAGTAAAQAPAPMAAAGGARSGVFALGVGAGPQPIQGRREQTSLTFVREGVEIRVPFDRIAGLVVERRDVVPNSLPPYVAPVRHSATAVLTDGSTVEADYVNFGTIILRGVGPQGSIELPLADVRTLKVTR